MSHFVTIVKVAGIIGTAFASVAAVLVLGLFQSSAADASVERADMVTPISATIDAPALSDTDEAQVELICSLAHIGPEQAAECKLETAKAERRQQADGSRH